MLKSEITEGDFENALWFPEDYHWGPSVTIERPTQGGGTAVWDQLADAYVFATPPDWWEDCKPGDLVPDEWGIL